MKFKKIYFYEEGMYNGSIACSFNSELSELDYKGNLYKGNLKIIAIDDKFVTHQTVNEALKELHFDSESIAKEILEDK